MRRPRSTWSLGATRASERASGRLRNHVDRHPGDATELLLEPRAPLTERPRLDADQHTKEVSARRARRQVGLDLATLRGVKDQVHAHVQVTGRVERLVDDHLDAIGPDAGEGS